MPVPARCTSPPPRRRCVSQRVRHRHAHAHELIANGRTDEEIAREIGCDALIYQDLDDLMEAVRRAIPAITNFDTSCFDGRYITGDVTPEYLNYIEAVRNGETPPQAALGHAAARPQSGGGKQQLTALVWRRA